MKRYKKIIAITALLMFLFVTIAGCGVKQTEIKSSSPVSSTQSLKIGVLSPLTGTLAAAGTDLRDGINLYLKQNDNKLGGKPATVVIEDSASDPGTAVTKAKKLVEQDKVDFLVGPLSAAEGNAVAPYAITNKIFEFLPIPTGDNLTQKDKNDFLIRTSYASSQPMYALAEYAYNKLGYKKVAAIAADYALGYESVGGFQLAFEQLGGKVVKKIWTPVGTKDFGPYLAQIPTDVDALFALEVGADAVNFIPNYKNYGIKLPLIGSGATTDESILGKLTDSSIGFVTALHYSAVLKTPENEKFVAGFKADYNRGASYYAEGGYAVMQVLDQALKGAGDQFKDSAKFIQATKNIKLTAPRGPMTLDNYNNPVQNVYIRKVEKVDGNLQNTVIETIPNVSQFWTFGADAVLARPGYSKDYPPIK